jgi:hypothetical protein
MRREDNIIIVYQINISKIKFHLDINVKVQSLYI